MDICMPEIGKTIDITAKEFKNLVTILFGHHGDIEINSFCEEGRGISSDNMFLYYLKISKDRARELFNEEEFEEFQDDGELHIATWQTGGGLIVDYSMTRKLLVWAAHTYPNPQPCVNCDIYKERVEQVGEENWAMHGTCQICIVGDSWINFTMKIEEE